MDNDLDGDAFFMAEFKWQGTGLVRILNLSSSIETFKALFNLSHAVESEKNA
jgi:hypothetical protein